MRTNRRPVRPRRLLVGSLLAVTILGLAACTATSTAPRSSPSGSRSSASGAAASSGTLAPTSPASPSASSPVASTVPRSVTVLGSGDVLAHPPLWAQAAADATAAGETGYDFRPMFAGVKSVTSSVDLATCELESPLGAPGGPFQGYPDFEVPPQVLQGLTSVGYRNCTTASNHSLDGGAAGVTRTLDALDAAGLVHTGSARSAAEAGKPLIVTTANGVKIAQLAYAFGFNGNTLPAGEPWLANLTDVPQILGAAHRAKLAGADIVVLSMHWGIEYNASVTALQTSEAQQLLASPDIDLILGDHPHVVEPLQQINGKWVIYSMGNEIARHDDPVPASRAGAMPIFTFTQQADGSWKTTAVRVAETWMQFTPAYRLVLAAAGSPDQAASDRAAMLTAAAGERTELLSLGATAAQVQIS